MPADKYDRCHYKLLSYAWGFISFNLLNCHYNQPSLVWLSGLTASL